MNWSRTLPRPIALENGGAIGTLAAALSLMLSLPALDQRQAIWRDVAELLAESAIDASWMPELEKQLSQALLIEGLIRSPISRGPVGDRAASERGRH